MITNEVYKILVLDNHNEAADLLQQAQIAQTKIIHIKNLIQAVDLITNEHWDLIIANTVFLKINHYILDVVHLTKSISPQTQVMLLANHNSKNISPELTPGQQDSTIYLPLEKSSFIKEIRDLITHRSPVNPHKERKVILAIGAHPDDVEIGCGGTLLHHREQGDEINILTLSSGEQGGDKSTRRTEAHLAANLLNAKLFLHELADTFIDDGANTIHEIERVIAEVDPTHVYTHSQQDNHQDHRSVHMASIVACRPIPNVYCYQSPSSTINFKPHHFVKIDDYIEEKIKLLALYESQNHTHPYLYEDMIRAVARYWGRFANYCQVEPMEVIKQIDS